MISAFVYLQLTSLRNLVVQRLRRLKQPKYLFGAIFGLGYFYTIFFRHAFRDGSKQSLHVSAPTIEPFLEPIGALLLLSVALVAWIFPSARAALQFSEAEVGFLFPAPVSRRTLIHFKLLKSQIGILFSALFFGLISNRVAWLGGNAVMHSLGWWVILSTINLHLLGVSFARESLLQRGVTARQRLVVGLGAVAAVGVALWFWLRATLPPLSMIESFASPELQSYATRVFASPPLMTLLFIPKLVLKPFFAGDAGAFAFAIGPALGLLIAHYWWVVRADVSFEEASIAQAKQTAEKVAAVRSGDWRAARNLPLKPRTSPFVLAAQGAVAVAFLWKNLIALGSFYRLRTVIIALAAIVTLHLGAWLIHVGREFHILVAIVAFSSAGWLLVAGPMFMRRDLRLLISHFDLLKSYPLPGWQVVLGSLISPIIVLASIETLLLLAGAPSIGIVTKAPAMTAGVIGAGSLGIVLVLPPLAGLMLSIPFAATLFFPAWSDSTANMAGGGIEAMGQRLMFFFGYVLVLFMTLIPAGLCAGVTAVIMNWLVGPFAAVVATTIVASIVISAEFVAIVWWLGGRFERFDLSQEIPR
ncbi:putative ABC exporter domain-containing protein [Oleiharenicola lentus]|uniref:putative ABC exporter domain-containing protein n=1 Tax=Oleiharenicola lentus TaxID=2508720 RepID=UPI003F66DB08